MFNTELLWSVTDTALQLRGGRGYETAASLQERNEFPSFGKSFYVMHVSIECGRNNDIMHLFLTREALDGHMKMPNLCSLVHNRRKSTKHSWNVRVLSFLDSKTPEIFSVSFLDLPQIEKLRAADKRSKMALVFFVRMVKMVQDWQTSNYWIMYVDIGTKSQLWDWSHPSAKRNRSRNSTIWYSVVLATFSNCSYWCNVCWTL